MAKITAKDVSQSAANAITGLASSRDKLRLLIGSLHQRSDEIAEMQRARQKERDLKEMQDRFDAARNAMNTAPAQPEGPAGALSRSRTRTAEAAVLIAGVFAAGGLLILLARRKDRKERKA